MFSLPNKQKWQSLLKNNTSILAHNNHVKFKILEVLHLYRLGSTEELQESKMSIGLEPG